MRSVVRRRRLSIIGACVLVALLVVGSSVLGAQTFSATVTSALGGYGRGTVTSSPAGINCTFDNPESLLGTGACRADFASGSTVVLAVAPKDGTTLTGWTGACAAFASSCTLVMSQDRATAVKLDPARVLVSVRGAGNGTGRLSQIDADGKPSISCQITTGRTPLDFCTAQYPFGSRVKLEILTPFSGSSVFAGFSSACSTPATCDALVNGPLTITGTFNAPEVSLRGAGTGSGRITGGALDCVVTATNITGLCYRVWDVTQASNIVLTATPDPGSGFTGWTGQCSGAGTCTTAGDYPPNGGVVARFDKLQRPLTLSGAGGGTGTVTSAANGIACTINAGTKSGTCDKSFVDGSSVTLTATPGLTSSFAGWDGACTGTATTCKVTMTDAKSVTARFEVATVFRLHVEHVGNYSTGRVVSDPAGIDCTFANIDSPFGGPACDVDFPAGTTVTLTATATRGGTFSKWLAEECTGTTLTCQVSMTQKRIVSMVIEPLKYAVTIAKTGNGAGYVQANDMYGQPKIFCNMTNTTIYGTCTSQYPVGARLTLEWTDNFNGTSKFGGFSGPNGECIETTCLPAIAGPTTIGVKFIALEVNVQGTGSGTGRVTSAGSSSINCAIAAGVASGSCAKVYDVSRESPLSLTASPDPGSRFVGWSGVCSGAATCLFAGAYAPAPTAAIARFELTNVAQQPVTVSGAGSGSGTVESSPGGIGCLISSGNAINACSASFPEGSTVALNATPSAGSKFAGWEGACAGTAGCSLTMSAARNVVARFDGTTATLTTTGTGSGSITSTPNGIACVVTNGASSGTCSAPFNIGTSVSLAAAPASGWTFSGWGGACSGSGTCQVSLSESRSVSASFTRSPVVLTLAGAGTGNGIVTSAPGGARCVITSGAAAATGCSVTLDQNASVTLTADPQFGSTFTAWEGDCIGTGVTCTVALSQARTVTSRFTSPHSVHDLAHALMGLAMLPPDERAQLDRFGNNDGTFNLGDLLALLDRTGEKLAPSTAAALMALPPVPPPSAAPAARRTP